MASGTALLIIDAQNDFCSPYGALYVPGAEQDVSRIAALITRHTQRIGRIFVTLDTHHILNIAHPLFWHDERGIPPQPFTEITRNDVDTGKWSPVSDLEYVKTYLSNLESQGAFRHFIWPEHCLVGSQGAALDDTIMDALRYWTHQTGRDYLAVVKGTNNLSEHFGVFRAQVPVAGDASTELNTTFLKELAAFDRILVAGEARSHCVATSLRQLIDFAPELARRVSVLTDCMSDVTGLGYLADPIFEAAFEHGMNFTTSIEIHL